MAGSADDRHAFATTITTNKLLLDVPVFIIMRIKKNKVS